ncbi:MAG: hypothetical protein WCD44_04590 [Candidatus Babeliales bacterium]
MGISYSIDALLDLKYEKNNIDYLFQKCIKNNIFLYSDTFYDMHKLDSIGATNRILSVELEPEDRSILAKFQDTDFFIWIFKKKNNLIKFSIGGFGITWRKEFIDDRYGIDFARYIRLFLRVCSEFTILSLETDAF